MFVSMLLRPFERRAFRYSNSRLAAAALAFICGLADAQPPPVDGDYFAELPVVLSASRLAQPANETPTAVTVIDREMIRASGATELPDVLRLVPGMVVGYPVGYAAAASYHGLSNSYARRMQVLVDGRTIYEPSFGGVNWIGVPIALDDIERIEVVRGPAAVSHGANAFLGVISITTRAAAAQQGLALGVHKGSAGIERGIVRVGKSGENFDYRLTAERRGNDGFNDVTDEYAVNQAAFRGDFRRTASDSISVGLGFSDTSLNLADALSPTHPGVSRNHYEQVNWRHTISPFQELNVQVFHNYGRDQEQWATDAIAYARDATKERFDAEFQHTLALENGHRVVWGGGARHDEVTDASAFNTTDKQSISLYRLFANTELRLGDALIVHAGAMWEDNQLVGQDASPRVAMNYHLSPSHTLRAGYSRAYRNPALTEDRGDLRLRDPSGNVIATFFRGTGGLEPERIDSWEIGYVGTYRDKGLTVDVKVYNDKIENLIRSVRDSNTGLVTFKNLDSAELNGAEVELTFQSRAHQRIFLSYAYEDIDSDNVSGKYTESAPRKKFSVLAQQRFGGAIEASGAYTTVDAMQWLGTRTPLDRYDRLDLRLAYLWTQAQVDGEVAAVVQGVSGPYADFVSTSEFERRAYLTLNLHLH